MQIWAWESVHYRWVFLENSNTLLYRGSCHVCFMLFHSRLRLWTMALVCAWLEVKGTQPGAGLHVPDTLQMDSGCGLSLSLGDVLICSVRQVFRPTWYLKSEVSHLVLDLGLSQSSTMRLVHPSQCAQINLFMSQRQLFFTGNVAFLFPNITYCPCTLFFFILQGKNT